MTIHPALGSLTPYAVLLLALGSACGSEPVEPVATSSEALSALDPDLCMQEVMDLVGTGHNLNCTAEDVDITQLVDVEILDDGCAFLGDTVTMNATFLVELNADHRLDIGLYFSENGVSAMNGNDDGGCTVHTLPIAESVDLEDGVPDEGFYCSGGLTHACNGDEDCPDGETCVEQSGTDSCGDMEGQVTTTIANFTMTCRDRNVNDLADFVFCSSWRQDGANDLCTTPYAAYPGAPSKCNCDTFDVSITIEDPCEDVVCEERACMVGVCDSSLAAPGNLGQALCVYTPTSGGACDDGSACTEGDVCDDGSCVGTVVDCDDESACTTDACDPASGCVYETVSCDDQNACTADGCDPATGCANETISCDDANACTAESCDPATGCGHQAISCDDQDACTADGCDPATGCGHQTISCDDQDACTADSCDPATGCGHTAVSCDDSNACTADSCDPATGCGHTAVSCDDSNACTADSCDPATGCGHTAVSCDDGDACTADSCDPVTGCGHAAVSCDDGDACTADSCDPVTGCGTTPISCDDGDACTADSCDPVGGCQHVDNGLCSGETTCETAFALASVAFCSTDIDCDGEPEVRWGWFDVISAGTSTTYTLISGAGQCNVDKGFEVGTVLVEYDGTTATFQLTSADGFDLSASHVYVSTERPHTMAPGQYTSVADYAVPLADAEHVIGGFGGEDLYIIVHTESCGSFPADGT